ncbi:TPA: DUF4931 domain-containing protein [Streptococcus agalactiae]
MCYNNSMNERYIRFNPNIAKQKPSNKDKCPFCDKSQLGKILDVKDDMIWVENKYPTLEETYQILVIESNDHNGDISVYSESKMRQLLDYLLSKWQLMEESGHYRSVVLYRNFGPLSGGSLRHPHSQIVGLKNVDAYETLNLDWFDGIEVCSETSQQAEISIANRPMLDFTEFTIKVSKLENAILIADSLPILCHYILNEFLGGRCKSYNLFFYKHDGGLICKIVPRFIVSPYQIGYAIHQVNLPDELEKIKEALRAKYYL